MKFWFLTAISLVAFSFCAHAQQETASDELQRRLGDEDGVIAQFEQQITNAQGHVIEASSGVVHLVKPNLRWEVKSPFSQIIILRRNRVQIYDPDLDQVTQRDLDENLQQVPLTLLTRTDLELSEYYTVSRDRTETKQQRFLLKPNSPEALFERIEIVFDGEGLQALFIFDHAQQQTAIEFSDYRSGQMIQSSLFKLDLPPDTDIVRG